MIPYTIFSHTCDLSNTCHTQMEFEPDQRATKRRQQLRTAFCHSTAIKYRNIPTVFETHSNPNLVSQSTSLGLMNYTPTASILSLSGRLASIRTASKWDIQFNDMISEANLYATNPDWTERTEKYNHTPAFTTSQDTMTDKASLHSGSVFNVSPRLRHYSSVSHLSSPKINKVFVYRTNTLPPTPKPKSPIKLIKKVEIINEQASMSASRKSTSCPNSPLMKKSESQKSIEKHQLESGGGSFFSDNSSLKSRRTARGVDVKTIIQAFDTRLQEMVNEYGVAGSNNTLSEEAQSLVKKKSWKKDIYQTDDWRDVKEGNSYIIY